MAVFIMAILGRKIVKRSCRAGIGRYNMGSLAASVSQQKQEGDKEIRILHQGLTSLFEIVLRREGRQEH